MSHYSLAIFYMLLHKHCPYRSNAKMRALKECVSSQPRWDCLRTNKPNSSDYRSCRYKHCCYCKTRTSQRYSSQHILTINDTFFSVVFFHDFVGFMSAKASNYYLLFANGLIKLKINNK